MHTLPTHGVIKILPTFTCVLVFILISLMTLWLDPKTSERIYLIALNIPCHIIFLHNIIWEITDTGDSVPYVSKYNTITTIPMDVVRKITFISYSSSFVERFFAVGSIDSD